MSMDKKRLGLFPALLVAVLSFGGFIGAVTLATQGNLTPVSFASDGEDDGDDDSDEDKDDDKDEDKDDDKDSDKKAKEESKKKAEREREATKKANEQSGKSSDDDGDDEDENEVEDQDENELDDDGDDNEGEIEDEDGDNNGMYKDRAKTISKLEEEIAKAEKEILEKQAEGVDVTAALARLAQAKAGVSSVTGAFDSNNLESAKELSKEVKKLAHFASEEDLHDAKEVAEDAAKVAKRITQAYGKIALLEAVGGDSATFKKNLAGYEADLAVLKATIAAGNYSPEVMSDALEALERKVKRLKSGIENVIYALGGTDSELDDDIEDESDDVAEHLNDVADIEDDSVGRVIRRLSDDHKDSAKKVGEVVKNVDKRNPVLQTLFGASESDLSDIEQEIAASKARAAVLEQAADTIDDKDVKAILLAQVETLQSQALKLEAFVSGQRDRLSLFGWFFNLGK